MDEFLYQASAATAEKAIPSEVWATKDFEAGLPMEDDLNISQYPWETTPDFISEPQSVVSPLANAVIITVPQRRVQEAARDYVLRIQQQLPGEVRDSFTRGTGMFDFPAPPDIDDQLG